MKIKSFKDLKSWQEATALALEVYNAINKLPTVEKYSLADQMRRSSTSVPSNIAEGFCRQSNKEKIHFYQIALDSLAELESQLEFCLKQGYLKSSDTKGILERLFSVRRLICGMIRYLKY